jgi:hypothetical protein
MTLALVGRHLANGQGPRRDLLLHVLQLLAPALGRSLTSRLGRCHRPRVATPPVEPSRLADHRPALV